MSACSCGAVLRRLRRFRVVKGVVVVLGVGKLVSVEVVVVVQGVKGVNVVVECVVCASKSVERVLVDLVQRLVLVLEKVVAKVLDGKVLRNPVLVVERGRVLLFEAVEEEGVAVVVVLAVESSENPYFVLRFLSGVGVRSLDFSCV